MIHKAVWIIIKAKKQQKKRESDRCVGWFVEIPSQFSKTRKNISADEYNFTWNAVYTYSTINKHWFGRDWDGILLCFSRPWTEGCVSTAQPLDWKGVVKGPAVHSLLAPFLILCCSTFVKIHVQGYDSAVGGRIAPLLESNDRTGGGKSCRATNTSCCLLRKENTNHRTCWTWTQEDR